MTPSHSYAADLKFISSLHYLHEGLHNHHRQRQELLESSPVLLCNQMGPVWLRRDLGLVLTHSWVAGLTRSWAAVLIHSWIAVQMQLVHSWMAVPIQQNHS